MIFTFFAVYSNKQYSAFAMIKTACHTWKRQGGNMNNVSDYANKADLSVFLVVNQL